MANVFESGLSVTGCTGAVSQLKKFVGLTCPHAPQPANTSIPMTTMCERLRFLNPELLLCSLWLITTLCPQTPPLRIVPFVVQQFTFPHMRRRSHDPILRKRESSISYTSWEFVLAAVA
jgi:hypothetical protein